jgi:hypothetical protein
VTGATSDPIKHPYGDFQKPVRPAASKIAPKHCITGLIDLVMDIDRLAKPRMPSIKNLPAFDNVGVLACCCTTTSARILPLAANHLLWSIGRELKQPTTISKCKE